MRPTLLRSAVVIVILAALGVLAYSFFRRSVEGGADLALAAVRRGNLDIDILEPGNVESGDARVIKCGVEGRTTILSIVAEGTILTATDVAEGRVLIELDSSNLRDAETQQQISLQSALASYADASASYEIQVKQNESDLKQGELKVKFGRMDLEKYLGERAAERFIRGEVAPAQLIANATGELGGEALQELRKLASEIDLAREEEERAKDKLVWSERLESQGYITRNELEGDRLALKRRGVALQQAITNLDLFIRYGFPKEAEKLRSDYEEAGNDLERIRARSASELAKAESRLRSSEATYLQQRDKLRKIVEQIANCVIRAPQPGMVVYAGSDDPWRGDRIEEGAEAREQQELIKIPNAASMVVTARIHESVITRVHEGLPATVTIEAIPEHSFDARVSKVAILPEAQSRWLNPNLKVYRTEVTLESDHPALKPGMSAQVRIIVNRLEDVLYVPLQAVQTRGDQRFCYVMTAVGPQKRVVEIGDYNDRFIEIRQGLDEGDQVVLNTAGLETGGAAPKTTRPAQPTAPVRGGPAVAHR